MENIHDLNIKSEGKSSDVLEAEKPQEPVNEERDMVENDGISELSQDLGYLNALVKSEDSGCDERIYDKTDVLEDDIEDRKGFIQQYLDEEGILCDGIDTISSKNIGTTKCFQHTTSVEGDLLRGTIQSDCDEKINRVANSSDDEAEDSKYFIQQYLHEEGKFCNNTDTTSSKNEETTKCFQHTTSVEGNLLGGTIQSGCDEIINRETNLSDDEAEDSKYFIQQYLHEEGKFCNNIDTTSLKNEETTKCFQYTTSVEGDLLGGTIQSGCDEIINRETNSSDDEPEDSKYFVQQYLDDEGKFCNNIDTTSLKNEDAARELHKNEILENEDANVNTCHGNLDECSTKKSIPDSDVVDVTQKINKCPMCEYITGSNLQLHIDTLHREMKKQKCHLCDYSSEKSSDLNRHIKSVHLKVKKHKCPWCDYSTAKNGDLNRHIKSVHLKVKKIKCHLCDFSFAKKGDLNRHIKSVHLKVKKQKCHLCDYSSAKSGDLNRHIKSVHLNLKKHKCHLCDYSTAYSGDLKYHIDGVHLKVKREKKYKCDSCEYSTANNANLKRHIGSIHLKVKKHKCHFCDYGTSYSGDLKCHIDSVHLKVKREKKHKCHFCEYSTAFISNLKRHIDNFHLKVKKHKCHLCDYSAAYSNDLNHHIESVHLKVRQHNCDWYKCHLCEYSTAFIEHLRSHINSVHFRIEVNKCHSCDYRAANNRDLNCHFDSKHLELIEKRHKCHSCDYSSTKSNNLKRHIHNKHLKVMEHK